MAGSSARRGRGYRDSFPARYGVSYGEARLLSLVQFGTPNSPARAARAAASTQRGLRLIESGGPRGESALRAAEYRSRGFNALADVRAGVLDVAGAEAVHGLAPGTLRVQFPSVVNGSGRVRVADREPAIMQVLSAERGTTYVIVRGSGARSVLGAHEGAIQHYLRTGDTRRLDALAGRRVGGVTLETNAAVIEALFVAGALPEGGPYPQARGTAT
jgi:hypothetical protein